MTLSSLSALGKPVNSQVRSNAPELNSPYIRRDDFIKLCISFYSMQNSRSTRVGCLGAGRASPIFLNPINHRGAFHDKWTSRGSGEKNNWAWLSLISLHQRLRPTKLPFVSVQLSFTWRVHRLILRPSKCLPTWLYNDEKYLPPLLSPLNRSLPRMKFSSGTKVRNMEEKFLQSRSCRCRTRRTFGIMLKRRRLSVWSRWKGRTYKLQTGFLYF